MSFRNRKLKSGTVIAAAWCQPGVFSVCMGLLFKETLPPSAHQVSRYGVCHGFSYTSKAKFQAYTTSRVDSDGT